MSIIDTRELVEVSVPQRRMFADWVGANREELEKYKIAVATIVKDGWQASLANTFFKFRKVPFMTLVTSDPEKAFAWAHSRVPPVVATPNTSEATGS